MKHLPPLPSPTATNLNLTPSPTKNSCKLLLVTTPLWHCCLTHYTLDVQLITTPRNWNVSKLPLPVSQQQSLGAFPSPASLSLVNRMARAVCKTRLQSCVQKRLMQPHAPCSFSLVPCPSFVLLVNNLGFGERPREQHNCTGITPFSLSVLTQLVKQ